jgi:4,5-DOPA dioxygenase extradiol
MSTTMPACFIGHGNPMNALERNRYTDAWRALGASVPTPRAIVVVSAHWYLAHAAVTAMARPRTIHDFSGFPDELFAVDYPAPGAPDVAEELAEIVKPTRVGLDHDGWGLDHGAWSVLVHLFPDADVPVVQLSLDATKPYEHHVALGAALAPLRDRGVLIVGSGNLVHNLRRVVWDRPDDAFDWAERFDEAGRALMTTDPGAIARLAEHPDHDLAVPSTDHFLPLLYLAGLAAAAGETTDVLVDGYSMGSLSMTCFTLGAETQPVDDVPAPLLPRSEVPPDETNT